MILCVTPNPCVDKTLFVETLKPGHKTVASRWSAVPGGKGNNVGRAVKALGGRSAAMVLVGGHAGRHVVDMIEHDDGVTCYPVWLRDHTRTITTVLESSVHRQTPLFEPGPTVKGEELDAFRVEFARRLKEARLVTLNGTVPCRSMEKVYRDLVAMARDAGKPVFLDSHGPEFAAGLASRPTAVKPNLRETEELVGFALDTEEARWRAVEVLHQKGVELVILSLGDKGALVSRGGEQYHVRPPEIREVNAVGSGDSLLAGFAIGLLEGMSLQDMAVLGVAAGTANAMNWDIGHFTRAEVREVAQHVAITPR